VHRRSSRGLFDLYGSPAAGVDFWQAVSLTEIIETLISPLQIHHAEDDPVVNIGYSYDLAGVLLENGKSYEFYPYDGGA